MDEYHKFMMWNLTWPEVQQNLKSNDIAIVSVSSTEQHGRHLPICTDAVIGLEVCKRTLKNFYDTTGQHALLAAELRIGMSKHHMSFPGSLSLEPETLMAMIKEVCLGLIHHGYKKIVLVNSHGGNRTVIEGAMRQVKDLTIEKGVYLFAVYQYSFDTKEWNTEISDAGPTGSSHAGERETSCMMASGYPIRTNEIPEKAILPAYILPEFINFKTTKYPGAVSWAWNMPEISKDGYMGDPTANPSAKKGEKSYQIRTKAFTEFLKQLAKL
jgi:creatinine amidohydrolase